MPTYLFIDKAVHCRGLSQSDLCEIAGVLLDNALEAARESPAPYISFELRRLEKETELVVRNTFTAEAQLCFTEGTTKPGHEAWASPACAGCSREMALLSSTCASLVVM